MRADARGTPFEQGRAAAGWRSASQIAGQRGVLRCHSCRLAAQMLNGASTATRWHCTRGQWATTAYATCDHAEPHPETAHV